MTKKDFFTLMIKLFGLYSCVSTLFTYLPSTLSYISISSSNSSIIITSFLFVLILIITLYWFVIQKAHIIVDKLNLSKGFEDDRIELNQLDSATIVKIATILIGGFLLVENLPSFLNHCYMAFLDIGSNKGLIINPEKMKYGQHVDYFKLSISIMNLIIGYLLISNYKWVSTKFIK